MLHKNSPVRQRGDWDEAIHWFYASSSVRHFACHGKSSIVPHHTSVPFHGAIRRLGAGCPRDEHITASGSDTLGAGETVVVAGLNLLNMLELRTGTFDSVWSTIWS